VRVFLVFPRLIAALLAYATPVDRAAAGLPTRNRHEPDAHNVPRPSLATTAEFAPERPRLHHASKRRSVASKGQITITRRIAPALQSDKISWEFGPAALPLSMLGP